MHAEARVCAVVPLILAPGARFTDQSTDGLQPGMKLCRRACRWLRAAFDEAQKAGAGSVAVMTQRLSAKHRWVVTGTPIGRGGLKDILALLRALNHYPMGSTPMWLPTEHSLSAGMYARARCSLIHTLQGLYRHILLWS